MDDQRAKRTIGEGMTEMPEERRLHVVRPSRKTFLLILAFIAGYAIGYVAGHHDGEFSMAKHWIEKTAAESAANRLPTH